jgi:putative oxidoreductase
VKQFCFGELSRLPDPGGAIRATGEESVRPKRLWTGRAEIGWPFCSIPGDRLKRPSHRADATRSGPFASQICATGCFGGRAGDFFAVCALSRLSFALARSWVLSQLRRRWQSSGGKQSMGGFMLRKLMITGNEYSLGLARFVLGVVFFAHGAQKMLGWFGGLGFSGTMGVFAKLGMPAAVALFAIFVEFFGGLSLLFGLLSRVAASAIIVEMIGAVFTVHIHNGFFMNWSGQQKGEGFEYHLIAIALALLIVVRGSGAPSVDYMVSTGESKRIEE